MGFSQVKFGKEEIFTTMVEDVDGRELEKWKVMKRDYPDVVRILNNKYGLGLHVINKKKKDKDLSWAL